VVGHFEVIMYHPLIRPYQILKFNDFIASTGPV